MLPKRRSGDGRTGEAVREATSRHLIAERSWKVGDLFQSRSGQGDCAVFVQLLPMQIRQSASALNPTLPALDVATKTQAADRGEEKGDRARLGNRRFSSS